LTVNAKQRGVARRVLTDAEALRELALGRPAALAVIYDRHRACLYRFFANATGHAQDVEDLVQATFFAAAKSSASFDGREDCRGWLLGIGAALLFRRRRTLARWARILRQFATSQEGRRSHTEPQILARCELNAVSRALSGLTEKKRVVLLLADLEQLSCEEIAKALDIPIGTVWTRLHHARRELRDRLELSEARR